MPVGEPWLRRHRRSSRTPARVQLGNTTYRLDGIDAPAVDQLCIDEHADVWTCGIEARDQLTKLIGGKQVHCDDIGVDPSFKKRRLGVCKIEGDPTSLSQVAGPEGLRPQCRGVGHWPLQAG